METINVDLEQYSMLSNNVNTYKLGISYGFSEFNPVEPLEIDQLIDRADQEMYIMKQEIRSKY